MMTPFKSKIKKIRKNYRNGGFYIFTDDGRLHSWGPAGSNFESLDSYNIEKFQGRIKDFFRVVHPEFRINRSLLITDDDQLYLEGLNDDLEREFHLVENDTYLSSHILTSHNQVILRADKKIEIFNPMFGKLDLITDTAPSIINYVFPTHQGHSFYVINDEGQVYFSKLVNEPMAGGMASQPKEILYNKDEFQAPYPAVAKKIVESGSYRAILDSLGSLHVSAHHRYLKSSVADQPAQAKILNKSDTIIDFTIVRKTKQTLEPILNTNELNEFERVCDVASARTEPWLGRPIGLNTKGSLVLANSGACQVLYDNVVTFEFKSKAAKLNPYGYSTSQLWLELISGEVVLFQSDL